jgi:hypothetical protein
VAPVLEAVAAVARIRCSQRAGRIAASVAPMTGRGTRPVGDYAKRTANVLGHAVRADLLGGGAVVVAVPAVCSEPVTEWMDVLRV